MKWLREPLVHFLALGAGLFLLFSLVGGEERDGANRIMVSAPQIELLAERYTQTWRRPPTAAERDALIEDFVREEVYYREALAMGLDRDDTIVRRRLRQKMEFFTDDLLAVVEPAEGELETFYREHPDRFRVEGRVSFEHAFFNLDQRGEAGMQDARRELDRLREATDGEVDVTGIGDRLPLPRRYADAPIDRLASRFGAEFVEALVGLPVGEWSGPVASAYGVHVVRVRERQAGRVAAFEEVRDRVETEWRSQRREEGKEAFYQELLQRYEVVIERP